ncbi:hypothetical protein Micbo1qcDRAFT_219488 [Microdochium bolleyi]|uniref:Peptidase M14 domain-containing protein n=1 Tax=Microdochium bolleyi TaxID=196109 RepID=A0A136ING2_9PEZI|nr:hypothetical protein Micbo1qcDRAFT_219488 [Microdochium bolleyi]
MKLQSLSLIAGLSSLSAACLLPEERANGNHRLARRQVGDNGFPIGVGDRFDGGNIVPRGLGTLPADTDLKSILSVTEIGSAFKGLAKEYAFRTFNSPYKTYENATIYGGVVGGSKKCNSKPHVFLNGAIHARERGSSDNLIYFLSDVLYAQKHKTGVTWGSKSYTYNEVEKALSAGIVFIPLSNPDGVAYDQATNSCWRKNRNPASSGGDPEAIGVDLNRNFDILWDADKHFEPTVALDVSSADPSSQVFRGTSAFSEPETKSIKYVMDTFLTSRKTWFIDIHSYTGDILYNWGLDSNQVDDPAMNFMNSTYDAVRGVIPDTTGKEYKEYLPQSDLDDKIFAAERMADGIMASTGRNYTVMPSAFLYPTSGASDDYAYSRHFVNPNLSKIHSYTLEFGFGNEQASCPFYPNATEYHNHIKEISATFMEFALAAVDAGLE